jgi:hypothetical protein
MTDTIKYLLRYVEQQIKEDNPLSLPDGLAIDYRDGYFVLMSDRANASHWIPVGGWFDLKHQRYESLIYALIAADTIRYDEE